jgi:integrase/recombinase XerD
VVRDYNAFKNLKALYFDIEGKPVNESLINNFELMNDYIIKRTDEGFTRSTVIVDTKALTEFTKCIDKDINVINEKDLRKFFAYLSGKSKATSRLYKTQVGSFLRFAKREDLTDLCKTRKSKQEDNLISPNELLTIEEIETLIDVATSMRDKALIATLYETGAREGELEELRISDVSFDEHGAIINLKHGKTGARRNRCIFAASYLRQWIESHPCKKDTNQFLWISNKGFAHLSYSTIWLMLKENAKKAEIKKRVNPHSFRHARATYLAKHMTEQELKKQLGWTAGSSMAGRYVHISGDDLDPTLFKMYGMDVEDKKTDDALKQIKCPRCKELQSQKAQFCFKCGLPLTQEAVTTVESIKTEYVQLADLDEIREMKNALKQELEEISKLKEAILKNGK